MQDLSFSRAFDVRRPALSLKGGSRGLAQEGAYRPIPNVARRKSSDQAGGGAGDGEGDRRRNCASRRLRRSGALGANFRRRALRHHGGGPRVMASQEPPSPLRMTYREACKQALRQALAADPRVFLMGEDIGGYGGCYAVTKGLLEEFGGERIRDT